MSNSEVFGSPMILRGRSAASPFGAAPSASFRTTAAQRVVSWLIQQLRAFAQRSEEQRRVRQTVVELSRLENHMLRDIGLNRAAILSAAHEVETLNRRSLRRQRG